MDYPVKLLVDTDGGRYSYRFYDRIVIGRYHESRLRTGELLIEDQTVSSRHCVITQDPDGRCFVRDTSRNGTRVDGRRLSPNSKTEIRVGQVISAGRHLALRIEGDQAVQDREEDPISTETKGVADTAVVTILVGDIRNYTRLVQNAPTALLQESVSRVFARLEKAVVAHGGTIKEFQGDSLFAFWERGSSRHHAVEACKAALDLRVLSENLARDASVWTVNGFALEMDWALTTGLVVISGHGAGNALGLSMVGEAVVLAYRIEKLADETTGPIIACPDTHMMAAEHFEFKDLGSRNAKGFDAPQRIYALIGEKAL